MILAISEWLNHHKMATIIMAVLAGLMIYTATQTTTDGNQGTVATPVTTDTTPFLTLPVVPQSTTTTVLPVTKLPVVKSNISSTPRASVSVGGITTTTLPRKTILRVGTGSAGATPTTDPAGSGPTYGAYVDPAYARGATNPLAVTYTYGATASTSIGGTDVALASLPNGTISLSADGSQICQANVGGKIASKTCTVTYAAFGSHSVTATYTNSDSYSSTPLVADIEPYKTTVVASIRGGGSRGGLVFDANVTDQNGNPVTTGSVSMTISDVTQGWSYVVTGTVGQDGADQSAFACVLIENYPRVGIYTGCGFSGPIQQSPGTGDAIALQTVYDGGVNWVASSSQTMTYSMPF